MNIVTTTRNPVMKRGWVSSVTLASEYEPMHITLPDEYEFTNMTNYSYTSIKYIN